MTEKEWEGWKTKLGPVIKSKAEEWQLLGYERVTEEDVWNCFMAKSPRLEIPEQVQTHWLVQELFRLKANDYMNWLTMEAYKGPSWFNKEKEMEFSLETLTKKENPTV